MGRDPAEEQKLLRRKDAKGPPALRHIRGKACKSDGRCKDGADAPGAVRVASPLGTFRQQPSEPAAVASVLVWAQPLRECPPTP